MRLLALAVLFLSGCPEPAPEPARKSTPIGPVIEKFEDKEVFWVLYNGRLARCWFDTTKGAPVCMVPPVIKVPPDAWLNALGIKPEPKPAKTDAKGKTYPVAPDWTQQAVE